MISNAGNLSRRIVPPGLEEMVGVGLNVPGQFQDPLDLQNAGLNALSGQLQGTVFPTFLDDPSELRGTVLPGEQPENTFNELVELSIRQRDAARARQSAAVREAGQTTFTPPTRQRVDPRGIAAVAGAGLVGRLFGLTAEEFSSGLNNFINLSQQRLDQEFQDEFESRRTEFDNNLRATLAEAQASGIDAAAFNVKVKELMAQSDAFDVALAKEATAKRNLTDEFLKSVVLVDKGDMGILGLEFAFKAAEEAGVLSMLVNEEDMEGLIAKAQSNTDINKKEQDFRDRQITAEIAGFAEDLAGAKREAALGIEKQAQAEIRTRVDALEERLKVATFESDIERITANSELAVLRAESEALDLANKPQEIRDANEKARASIAVSWKSLENTQSLIDNRGVGGEVFSDRDLADVVLKTAGEIMDVASNVEANAKLDTDEIKLTDQKADLSRLIKEFNRQIANISDPALREETKAAARKLGIGTLKDRFKFTGG